MSKSLFSFAIVALLAAGCVSVGPPATAEPTAAAATPTADAATPQPATPAPATAAPTAEPTAAPTPTPTAEPTATPTAEPTPTAEITPEPTPDLVMGDLLFSDDFSDPASGWDPLNEPIASVDYDSGDLVFRFNETGWAYTTRALDTPVPVLRPAAEFLPDGDGVFGVLCGSAAGQYGAVIGTDGGWVFIKIDSAGVQVLSRDDEAGIEVPVGQSLTFGLQCTSNADGSLNMELVIPDQGPIAVHSEAGVGISTFTMAGLYGEALEAQFNMAVVNAAAFGLGTTPGVMSATAQELMAHIPTEFQVGCAESAVPPLFTELATEVVTCLLQTSGDGSEIAEYVQFADAETMEAAYQDRVETFGVTSQGSCQNGPNETTWSINEVVLGRIQCAPQHVGARYDWTDDRLFILATLVDFDGDFGAMYQQWLNAGPNE